MANLLVDTDIFVDHLRGAHPLKKANDRLHYSVLTRCELFAGNKAEEQTIRRLLEPLDELGVDRKVAERAGRLRRATHLRLPDAVIAATALEHGLGLMTRNLRDFAAIRGLNLKAPR